VVSIDTREDLSDGERQLVDCYETLIAILREHEEDLPPYAERNAIKAAAALWQVANGAGTQPGHIYDSGA
jgi:hypothetical protein